MDRVDLLANIYQEEKSNFRDESVSFRFTELLVSLDLLASSEEILFKFRLLNLLGAWRR